MNDYKQYVLATGQEIVAEVVEENYDTDEIIVRNCLALSKLMSPDGNYFYIFKPMMTYIEGNSGLISINAGHVSASANPHHKTLDQYFYALSKLEKDFSEELSPDDNMESFEDLITGGLEDLSDDSIGQKVVQLFNTPKNKLH